MYQDKVLSMIGLAKRANKVCAGAPLCEKEIKANKSELIIIAKDISENGRKAITDSCKYYSVKYIEYSTKEDLGRAVGAAGDRTVLSINDKGFADAVMNKYADLLKQDGMVNEYGNI